MARYKNRSRMQGVMMPIHLEAQIVPGTFEHTIDYLVANEIDLSVFEHRYSHIRRTRRSELIPRSWTPDGSATISL